jgi:signal peptide peptidase SppA
VAVVGFYGTIVHRASMFTNSSGLTSAEAVGARVRAAAADPGVRAIVLDVDSPGGTVTGMTELAAEIRAARAVKPVAAVANAQAASAAYWAFAQASPGHGYVTPSGRVGSVGVFVEHEDRSEANAREGRKFTTIAYGQHKALGGPNEPLSEAAREELEKTVAEYGRQFEADVAKGRGVSVETVRKEFGQGLSFVAREALERGMVDAVATLDEVVRKMGSRRAVAAPAAAAVDQGRALAQAKLRGLRA